MMIQFGDYKDCELKGVNLFTLEIGKISLSIYKLPVFKKFEVYNGKYCFIVQGKYFYFRISKQ